MPLPTSRPGRRHRLLVAAVLGATLLVASPAAASACDTPLVRVAPGVDNGPHAPLVLTSQVLEEGVDGYAAATWQLAADVTPDALQIVDLDGTTSLLPPTPTGTVIDVQELIACGSLQTGNPQTGSPQAGGPQTEAASASPTVPASESGADAAGTSPTDAAAAALALLAIGRIATRRTAARATRP